MPFRSPDCAKRIVSTYVPVLALVRLRNFMAPKSLSAMNKAEMQEELRGWSEEAPTSWGKTQLAARISEIRAENQTNEMTERKLVTQINKFKNREALREHLTNEGVTWSPHQTNADLKSLALKHGMSQVPPTPSDLMGFGKHAKWTYGETLIMDSAYTKWCITTTDEEESPHWRLVRFANWARNLDTDAKKKVEQGVTKAMVGTSSVRTRSSRASAISSASWQVAEDADETELMHVEPTDAEKIAALEAELQDLRRKTGETKTSKK